MNKSQTKISAFFILISIIFGCSKEKQAKDNGTVVLGKGVNISHWLSQSQSRGEARREYFKEKDVLRIAEAGFDHIRIPIDEEQMWNEDGHKEADAFLLLNNAIQWALKANLKVVVDLHIIRSHHFLDKDPALFRDEKEAIKLAGFWRQLSEQLKVYPRDMVIYEVLNESVAQDHEDWNRVFMYPYNEIRKLEPERTIILGSNRWQSASTFPYLKVPDDPNMILSFHFYTPIMVTHYKASWNATANYDGPIHYPGQTIMAEDTIGAGEALSKALASHDWGFWYREKLEEIIKIPVQIADSLNLPLYCGEFGCYSPAPPEIRAKWFNDVLYILNKKNISWAVWDYKSEGFGLFNDEGTNPIFEVIEEKLL